MKNSLQFERVKKIYLQSGFLIKYWWLVEFCLQDYGINDMDDTITCFNISNDNIDSVSTK